jgi:hypothetical protein
MFATNIEIIEFCPAGHAGSRGFEPVAPARKINDFAEPGSDWLQNPNWCRYKNHGFRS